MSYETALKEAGAVVHAMRSFGSYQGNWFAFITYGKETGWVEGWYGSCDHCDSFQREFGDCSKFCEDHRYNENPVSCEKCEEKKIEYAYRLAEFGRVYCEGVNSSERIVERLRTESDWDGESQDALQWILETEAKFIC